MKVTDNTEYLNQIAQYSFPSEINAPIALTWRNTKLYIYDENDYKIYELSLSGSTLTITSSWSIQWLHGGSYYQCTGIKGIATDGTYFYATSRDVAATPFDDEEIFKFSSSWLYIDSDAHGEDAFSRRGPCLGKSRTTPLSSRQRGLPNEAPRTGSRSSRGNAARTRRTCSGSATGRCRADRSRRSRAGPSRTDC